MTFFGKAVLISAFFTKIKTGMVIGFTWFFLEVILHDMYWLNKDIMTLD